MTEIRAAAPRRGVAILPSLFTTGNLLFGFWSLVKTLDGRFFDAAALILGAIVLDLLDGRIARLTNTTSEFGAELDSLADAISFGVAPALLAYRWALDEVPRFGWPVAFLFALCGVLRLARFNVQRSVVDARWFVGLPIPAGAGQLAAIVLFLPEHQPDGPSPMLFLGLVVALAFLMVSTLRYRSFKGIDLRRRRSYVAVLLIAAIFLVIVAHPSLSLLLLASLYTLSGPTAHLASLARRRGGPPPAVAPDPAAGA